MNLSQKALNDVKLAIENTLPNTKVSKNQVIISHKDILDCLKNINTESYNQVCQFIDYQAGVYIPIKWFQLLEMVRHEITNSQGQ
jgi:hypothetical protein